MATAEGTERQARRQRDKASHRVRLSVLDTASSDQSIRPAARSAAHRLIGNHNSAFRQQILNVTEAQGEPDIKPDRLLDNLGREAVAAIVDLGHHRWLRLKVTDCKSNGDVTMPSPKLFRTVSKTLHAVRMPRRRRG